MPEISNVGLGIPRYPNRGFAINQTLLNTVSTDTGRASVDTGWSGHIWFEACKKRASVPRLLRAGPNIEEGQEAKWLQALEETNDKFRLILADAMFDYVALKNLLGKKW